VAKADQPILRCLARYFPERHSVHLAVGCGDLLVLFEEGYEFQQFLLFFPRT